LEAVAPTGKWSPTRMRQPLLRRVASPGCEGSRPAQDLTGGPTFATRCEGPLRGGASPLRPDGLSSAGERRLGGHPRRGRMAGDARASVGRTAAGVEGWLPSSGWGPRACALTGRAHLQQRGVGCTPNRDWHAPAPLDGRGTEVGVEPTGRAGDGRRRRGDVLRGRLEPSSPGRWGRMPAGWAPPGASDPGWRRLAGTAAFLSGREGGRIPREGCAAPPAWELSGRAVDVVPRVGGGKVSGRRATAWHGRW
jgi:hypothetical protein